MIEIVIFTIYVVILYTAAFLFLLLMESETITSEVEELKEWPSVTIAIPAYNEEDTIADTIESVRSTDYPQDKLEVIVIDDGSTDNTKEIAEEYEAKGDITFISQENQGKGGALNTALDKASGELFGCVDADSMLGEQSLKRIVARMDDAAGVASAMKVYKPRNLLEKIQMIEYIVSVFTRKLFGKIESIHVTPGALGIYRQEDIVEVGGFDEESLVEDQEICFRLQEKHKELRHARDAEVYTVAPDNLRDYYWQRRRWYAGTFETLIQYRSIILNREYGDFGMFTLPLKTINPILSIIGLFLITNALLRPALNFFLDLMRLGTDALNLGFTLTPAAIGKFLKWQLLGIDYTFLTVLSVLAIFSGSLVYLATIHVNERIRDIGLVPALIYVFWFFIIVGFMSLVSIIVVSRNYVLGDEIGW